MTGSSRRAGLSGYFDWAATRAPMLVLGAWAAGGLVLGLLGERYGPHVRSASAFA